MDVLHAGSVAPASPHVDPFGRSAIGVARSPEALFEELHAHQEELRTQNAQLAEMQGLLEQTVAEYTDLYDYAPVGFVMLNPQGLISRMNLAAADLLGVKRAQLAAMPFGALIRPPDQPVFREHLRRCRAGEPRAASELALRRSDGSEVPVELISRPAIGDGRGFFRTVLIDLTERKLAEARAAELTAESQRRTVEAEQYAARLRALAAKLTEAETAERRRLTRNLHDYLQQELIAAKYAVAIARGEGYAGAEKLTEIEASLDRCLDASRQITADLTPPPLQQGAGLPAALRWLGDRTHERHGLDVTVKVSDDAEPSTESIRSMLYEVARKLLLNVIKHAGIPAAAVTLVRPRPEWLRLAVADEGRGFDLAELMSRADEVSGLGLFGLRERVENLGGVVEIRSGPGTGTTVTIEVPDLKHAEAKTALDQIPR